MIKMKNYQRYSRFVVEWRNTRFPARPSKEEIVVFDSLMKNSKNKRMLILGATPELRDLAFKNKLKVTCADINEDMLKGMKQLMQYQNDNEKLVKCNWLKMPFPDNHFDLVFAEQSINIIEAKHFDDFLKEVKRVMKENSRFVLKTMIMRDINEDEIIQRYRMEKRDISYLYDMLVNDSKHYKNNQRGHKEFAAYFDNLLKLGKITRKEHAEYYNVYGMITKADLRLNSMKKKEFERLLKKYFKIKDILYGEDFDKHVNHPIYVLEKEYS